MLALLLSALSALMVLGLFLAALMAFPHEWRNSRALLYRRGAQDVYERHRRRRRDDQERGN